MCVQLLFYHHEKENWHRVQWYHWPPLNLGVNVHTHGWINLNILKIK